MEAQLSMNKATQQFFIADLVFLNTIGSRIEIFPVR